MQMHVLRVGGEEKSRQEGTGPLETLLKWTPAAGTQALGGREDNQSVISLS